MPTIHWAHQAAESLARRTAGRTAVIETGYGPSGLPHMGTVAEVLRSAMVARAYRDVTGGGRVRFLSVTDDMDGLRRVPATVPAGAGMEQCIGRPLCDIPNPWGDGSFAAHNASLLRDHLRHFGLRTVEPHDALARLSDEAGTAPDEILCIMASDLYRGGHYDAVLQRVAARAGEIGGIVLPDLGAERRRTWCPFVPIHDGQALAEIDDWEISGDVIGWRDSNGQRLHASILGGGCKLQWRADWSARWVALGVDFEMHGKDLMDSVRLGSRIAPLLGGRAPLTFQYELFLDESGAKMSKSVGNGVGVDEWRRHAPPAVFRHFLARDPRAARRIGPATIPRAVDEWLDALRDPAAPSAEITLAHEAAPPVVRSRLSFATILGVSELSDAEDPRVVVQMLAGHDPVGVDGKDPLLSELVQCAVARHLDIGRPQRRYRVPYGPELEALADLIRALRGCPPDADAVQFEAYEVGKAHGGREGLREFFRLVYGTLLGADNGPRIGTLAEAIGVDVLADRIASRAGLLIEPMQPIPGAV